MHSILLKQESDYEKNGFAQNKALHECWFGQRFLQAHGTGWRNVAKGQKRIDKFRKATCRVKRASIVSFDYGLV